MAMHVLRAQSARPAPGPTQRSAAIPLLLPRRLLEHFRPVPGQKLGMRQAFLPLRLDQPGAAALPQLGDGRRGDGGAGGDFGRPGKLPDAFDPE